MRQKMVLLCAALLLAVAFSGCDKAAPDASSGPDKAPSVPPATPVSLPFPASGGAGADSSKTPRENNLPEGFVYVDEVVEGVVLDIRYHGEHNFVGAPIDGYEAPLAILSEEAAAALQDAARQLAGQGYVLKIFDAYRPVQAVEHFQRWSEDAGDQKMKAEFYPDLEKDQLFPLGYLAGLSGHSRGSTVDLTLVEAATGREVDMGTPFDYFGPESGFNTDRITEQQAANRQILEEAMRENGFISFSGEWWHYLLAEEPFPDTYFDFPVR